jgi:NAD(P)-dependent dehydrogenase (short-subunit alcohol dehydrogenase family)
VVAVKDLAGKVAVVTGAGSGIGRGTSHALADAGMHVVVSDIDEANASVVADELRAKGVKAAAVRTDVSDRSSVEALADAAYSELGEVRVLHNNAGVGVFVRLDETTDADWRWILGVNLEGVVNGIQAFLPRMQRQGGECHIVNTASMAGMLAGPQLGAYNATKFAVVAISETLRYELAAQSIGVSVLCPGGVSTNIIQNSLSRRPAAGAPSRVENLGAGGGRMVDPMDVGRMVRHGIETNDPYIFTHPEMRGALQHRFDRIMAGFDRASLRDARLAAERDATAT